MRKYSLFVSYNLYKDSNSELNLKEKALKNNFSTSKTFLQSAHPTLRGKNYADACITLNVLTAPVAFAPRRVSHVVFLISLVLEQTSEDCIWNTEH